MGTVQASGRSFPFEHPKLQIRNIEEKNVVPSMYLRNILLLLLLRLLRLLRLLLLLLLLLLLYPKTRVELRRVALLEGPSVHCSKVHP